MLFELFKKFLFKSKLLYVLLAIMTFFYFRSIHNLLVYEKISNTMTIYLACSDGILWQYFIFPIFLFLQLPINLVSDLDIVIVRNKSLKVLILFKLKAILYIILLIVGCTLLYIVMSIVVTDNLGSVTLSDVVMIIYNTLLQIQILVIIGIIFQIFMLVFYHSYINIVLINIFILVAERLKFILNINSSFIYSFCELIGGRYLVKSNGIYLASYDIFWLFTLGILILFELCIIKVLYSRKDFLSKGL